MSQTSEVPVASSPATNLTGTSAYYSTSGSAPSPSASRQIKICFVPLDSTTSDEVLRSGYKALVNLTLKSSKSWNHVVNYFRSKWAKVPHLEGRLEVFALDASMGSVLGPNLLQPPRTSPIGMSRLPPPLPSSPAHASTSCQDPTVHQLHYRLIPLLPFGGTVGNTDRTFGDLMLQMLLNRNGSGAGATDSFGQLLLSSGPVDSGAANSDQLVPVIQANASSVRGMPVSPSNPLPIALPSITNGSKRRRDGAKNKSSNTQSPLLEAPPISSEPHHAHECMETTISDSTIDFLLNSLVGSNTGSQCQAPDGDAQGLASSLVVPTERPACMSENTMDNILLSIIADGTIPASGAYSLKPSIHVSAFSEVPRCNAAMDVAMLNEENAPVEVCKKKSRTETQYSENFSTPSSTANRALITATDISLAPVLKYPVLVGPWERARASGLSRPTKRIAPRRIGDPGDASLFVSETFLE